MQKHDDRWHRIRSSCHCSTVQIVTALPRQVWSFSLKFKLHN